MINVLVIQYFDQDRHYLNHSFYRHLNNHIHYPDNYSEPVLCEPCGQEAPWFRLSHSLDLDSERDHCEIVCLFLRLFSLFLRLFVCLPHSLDLDSERDHCDSVCLFLRLFVCF